MSAQEGAILGVIFFSKFKLPIIETVILFLIYFFN